MSTKRRLAAIVQQAAIESARTLLDLFDMRVLFPAFHPAGRGTGPVVASHLRDLLEDLGPTFVKLGQVLSTRPDLVPPAVEAELARLQDSARPVPFALVADTIERALGTALADAYLSVDPVPLAAASIGQVHAATLHDGTPVVVKVRRPHVVDDIEVDLAALHRLAAIATGASQLAARYDLVGLAEEFAQTLRGEVDYEREGRNAEMIAEGFAETPSVHIPRVFWTLTCEDVITEARVEGTKIDDIAALDAIGVDRAAVAGVFVDAYLSMVFDRGFFHADPHPGNVFVSASGHIAFVDFGMVGRLAPDTGTGLGAVLLALVATDATAMADGLLGLGVASGPVDRPRLEYDLRRMLDRYANVPLEQLHIGPLLAETMSVVRAHRLRLPSDLALLLKTVMMCEGVAAQLDPSFELVPRLVPYATRIALDGAGKQPPGSGVGPSHDQ